MQAFNRVICVLHCVGLCLRLTMVVTSKFDLSISLGFLYYFPPDTVTKLCTRTPGNRMPMNSQFQVFVVMHILNACPCISVTCSCRRHVLSSDFGHSTEFVVCCGLPSNHFVYINCVSSSMESSFADQSASRHVLSGNETHSLKPAARHWKVWLI